MENFRHLLKNSERNDRYKNAFEVTSTNVKKLKSLEKDHMPQETEQSS